MDRSLALGLTLLFRGPVCIISFPPRNGLDANSHSTQHGLMDRSLARGYAKRFLDQLTPYGAVLAWHDSPRKRHALDRFIASSYSKKPGRVLERLHPLVTPTFSGLEIVAWNRKQHTIVVASAISSARECAVLHPEDGSRTLFDERAAFYTSAVFRATGEEAKASGATTASVCGHAVGRLLERGLATPETLKPIVRTLLRCANDLQIGIFWAEMDHARPWMFLVPVPGGAAVAVTHRVRPSPAMASEEFDMVASVRTVLREDMLSSQQRERMAGFEAAVAARRQDPRDFPAWVRKNARPGCIRPAMSLRNRGAA